MSRRDWGKIAKKGKRYYAEYLGPDGRRHTPGHSFAHKGDAEGWLRDERRLIDLDAWHPPAVRRARSEASGMTVGEWLDHFHDLLEARPKPPKRSTMQQYRRVVRTRITQPVTTDRRVLALKDHPLRDLTTADVYRWWDGLQVAFRGTTTTNQHAYKRLRAACEEAVQRQIIKTNPVLVKEAGQKVRAKEKYLPEDWEIDAILHYVPDRYKAITSAILHHGVRIGEAIAIEDVVIGDAPVPYLPPVTMRITRNAQRIEDDGHTRMVVMDTPKTDAGVRDVPVLACDAPLFIRHACRYPAPQLIAPGEHGPVRIRPFTTTSRGNLLWDSSYRSILERAEIKAGVTTDIDPHCGRNWLITRLAEQGAHPKEIGAILGQEDVSTILEVYLKVRTKRPPALMERVSKSVGG